MQLLALFLASASLAAAHQQPTVVTVTKYLPFEQHPCYAYFMLGGQGQLPEEACQPGSCCVRVQHGNTNTGHDGATIGPDHLPMAMATHSPGGSSQSLSGSSVSTQSSLNSDSSNLVTSGSVVAVLSSDAGSITKTLVEAVADDCTVTEDHVVTSIVTVPQMSRETAVVTTTVPKVVTYTTTSSGIPIIETSTSIVVITETVTSNVAISTTKTMTVPVVVTVTEVITANESTFTSLVTTTCNEVVTSIVPIFTTITVSATLATPVEVTPTKVITMENSTVTSTATITSNETVISTQSILANSTTTSSKQTVTSIQSILTNTTTTEMTTQVTSISTAVTASNSTTTSPTSTKVIITPSGVVTTNSSTVASLTSSTKTTMTPSVVVPHSSTIASPASTKKTTITPSVVTTTKTTITPTIVKPITSLIPKPPTTTKSRVIPSSCPTPTCSKGIQYALYSNPFRRDMSPTYKTFSPAYFKKTQPVYSTTLQTAIYITDDRKPGKDFDPLFRNAAASYRGFLFACQAGRYRFNSPYSDDITIMWFGDKAYGNYTRDNADIIQFFYGDNRPRNIYRDLEAGTYYPIRVLWGNTGGASDLSLRIYGPAGEDVSGADQSGEHFLTTEACDGSYAPFAPWGKEP
ncbi:GLEYA adhesin domain [Cordyceps militaris]|uniref:GLEYA adhesin domain n=1 Tax=Cordyceps militaris TaxID=73501 RepID=A0A2H4S5W9_CORMI|nr:GLEYA adhesin domain [Cordyceps militaris]